MDFSFSPEQESLRKKLIAFANESLNPGAAEREKAAVFSRDLWKRCADAGILGLAVPEEFGGQGHDPVTVAAAMEALGYACEDAGFLFAMGAHMFACAAPLVKFGTAEQKARFLPALCDGTLVAVNSMTEPEAGSDMGAIAATAERCGDVYKISGEKTMGTNGPVADLALIFAATAPEKGCTKRSPGSSSTRDRRASPSPRRSRRSGTAARRSA
ncbi:MAG: acyl-CoA dehydrogenase family protein [Verrucomicrobiales bacterium]